MGGCPPCKDLGREYLGWENSKRGGLEEGSRITVQELERKLLELDHVEPGEGGKSTGWRGARSWAL